MRAALRAAKRGRGIPFFLTSPCASADASCCANASTRPALISAASPRLPAGERRVSGHLVLVSPALEDSDSRGGGGREDWCAQITRLHNRAAGVWVGLSRLRLAGCWSLRLVAPDGARLRSTVAEVRRILARVLPPLGAELRKL